MAQRQAVFADLCLNTGGFDTTLRVYSTTGVFFLADLNQTVYNSRNGKNPVSNKDNPLYYILS